MRKLFRFVELLIPFYLFGVVSGMLQSLARNYERVSTRPGFVLTVVFGSAVVTYAALRLMYLLVQALKRDFTAAKPGSSSDP